MHVSYAPFAPQSVFDLGIPVLGICYGMQTMAGQLGGVVAPADHREFGYAQVRTDSAAAVGVGARRSAAKSASVTSVS